MVVGASILAPERPDRFRNLLEVDYDFSRSDFDWLRADYEKA
jgi:hypothetical protein